MNAIMFARMLTMASFLNSAVFLRDCIALLAIIKSVLATTENSYGLQLMMKIPSKIWHKLLFLIAFIKLFEKRGCLYYAAALAFNTMFALVPLLLLAFAMLSFSPLFHQAATDLEHWVMTTFLPGSANVINAQIDVFVSHSRDLSYMNFSTLLLVSLSLIFNMHSVVNKIWQVESSRRFISEILIYLVVMVVSPILLSGIFLFFTSVISDDLWAIFPLKGVWHFNTTYVIPFVTTFISFFVLQWVLPSCHVPIKHAALSGILTTILFMCAKYLFVLYLEWFHTYQLLYGALALVPMFLLWLYIVWVIFLFGSMFCQHLTKLKIVSLSR